MYLFGNYFTTSLRTTDDAATGDCGSEPAMTGLFYRDCGSEPAMTFFFIAVAQPAPSFQNPFRHSVTPFVIPDSIRDLFEPAMTLRPEIAGRSPQ
jgi:hypothetical protein